MITRMAGPDGVVGPGQVVEVPDWIGDELVAGGFAEVIPVDGNPAEEKVATVETATLAEAPEAAVGRGHRRKKR